MKLQSLPYQNRESESQVVSLRGLNLTDNYKDGSLSDSVNISFERYPFLSTKNGRGDTSFTDVTDITSYNGLIYVKKVNGVRHLFYNNIDRGSLSDTDKQFAFIINRMVIWPDKKVMNLTDGTISDMEASVTHSGTVTYTENGIRGSWYVDGNQVDLTNYFAVDDVIEITGCGSDYEDHNGWFLINEVTANGMVFKTGSLSEGTETNNSLKMERSVPDMDYISSYNNRLCGCSSSMNEIYFSAYGLPNVFYAFENLESDAYSVSVSSEGNFTGCTNLGSSVLFFKEQKLHKILGTTLSNFQMVDYNMEGVKDGCFRSLTNINEVLYYVGITGVRSYNGSTCQLVSYELGDIDFRNAVGGYDGENYYLSAQIGNTVTPVYETYIYSPLYQMWLKEDSTRIKQMTRVGNTLYVLTNNGLKTENGGSQSVQYKITFKPFYETITGSYNKSSIIYGYKRHRKLVLRAEVSEGANMRVEVRRDDGEWKQIKNYGGVKNGIVICPIPIGRCDKFEISLSGVGKVTLLNMLRDYVIGGRL